jgi:hypothetical protein
LRGNPERVLVDTAEIEHEPNPSSLGRAGRRLKDPELQVLVLGDVDTGRAE